MSPAFGVSVEDYPNPLRPSFPDYPGISFEDYRLACDVWRTTDFYVDAQVVLAVVKALRHLGALNPERRS